MKQLNWDAIPRQSVMGKMNVWTSERSKKNLVLDTRSMEELFSLVENRLVPQQSNSLARKSFEGRPPLIHQTQVSG